MTVGLEMVYNRTNLNPSPSAVDSNPSTFNPSGSQGWSPKQLLRMINTSIPKCPPVTFMQIIVWRATPYFLPAAIIVLVGRK